MTRGLPVFMACSCAVSNRCLLAVPTTRSLASSQWPSATSVDMSACISGERQNLSVSRQRRVQQPGSDSSCSFHALNSAQQVRFIYQNGVTPPPRVVSSPKRMSADSTHAQGACHGPEHKNAKPRSNCGLDVACSAWDVTISCDRAQRWDYERIANTCNNNLRKSPSKRGTKFGNINFPNSRNPMPADAKRCLCNSTLRK